MATAGKAFSVAEFNALLDKTVQKPICRLVASGVQSIPDNVATALSFTAEAVDTHGFHDNATNPTRATPTRAGWYTVRGTYYSASPVSLVVIFCFLRTNGATTYAPGPRANSGAIQQSVSTTVLIPFNGTTDYVELMAQQDSSAAVNTNQSLHFSSVLELIYERDL